MTNQKAAEMIRNDMKLHHDSLSGEYRKALNMAISALQEQDVPDTNFGDMISRQVAIDALMAEPLKWDDSSVWESARCYQWMMDMDAIKALPSAQPEQSDTSEFWRKRADYYSDMCMDLIGEMGKGVKIESVKISENGIEFIKEQPSAQPEPQWIPVSERLPKIDVSVLVTTGWDDLSFAW